MNQAKFFDLYRDMVNRKKIPVVTVDASQGEVIVPREYINEDGTIQLSLSPKAIRDLRIINDLLYCRATFKEEVFSLSFPLSNIIDMYEDEGDISE